MKKILLLTAISCFTSLLKTSGQCTVSNLSVEVNSITPNGGNACIINFDLSWVQEINAGNKFAYVHLWNGNYHTPAPSWTNIYNNPSSYPQSAELANSLLTICIENNNSATPSIGTTYYPDPSITEFTATSVVKTPIDALTERMTMQNITLSFTNCAVPITLQGDIWASQAANGKNVHCANQGLSFVLNDPRITGFMACTNPRTFNLGITTTSLTNVSVFYKVYKDDGDGIYEPGTQDVLVATSASFNVSSTTPFSGAGLGYTGNGNGGENGPLWVEVLKTAGGSFSTVAFFASPFCAPLPVEFRSFTAARTRSNVLLVWETASERNNTGFAVERNTNGSWEQIAWIPTQAQNGNSDATLAYSYIDVNNVKGISQYRIRQVDIDAKATLSVIRSVRGEGQPGKTIVYPNPSNNGKINVIFEDASVTRNVMVADMSGRTVRQMKGITNNNITIENLNPGMYTIRIVAVETGEQAVEKVIVNKR